MTGEAVLGQNRPHIAPIVEVRSGAHSGESQNDRKVQLHSNYLLAKRVPAEDVLLPLCGYLRRFVVESRLAAGSLRTIGMAIGPCRHAYEGK
jgi:hypothetical protein